MLWLFLGILFFFTIFGVPIVFCLGIANIVMLLVMNIPLTALAAKVIQGADSFPLLAIPFFMFVGEVMNRGA
jgi:TRAP-type mannitol/chloroaromatic compound transport system permease large subunit